MALRAESSPVEAVGAAVRDFTPGPLAVFLVHLVRHGRQAAADRRHHARRARDLRVRRLLDAPLPAPPRPRLLRADRDRAARRAATAAPRRSAPRSRSIVGLITWIVTLRVLTAPLLGEPPHVRREPTLRRRDFLVRGALVVGGVAVLTVGARIAGSGRRKVEQARRLLRLPGQARRRSPSGANIGVPGIAPWRTPNKDFYVIHTALAPPSVSPEDWQLRIHGMVERELTLQLPGPARPPADRGLGHAVLRVQRGRRRPDRQRVLVRRTRARAARRGRREAGRQRGAADLAGRLGLRYAAGRAHRPRAQRDAGDRDERPAAARAARVPGADGGARALRLRLGRPSGWSTSR